MFIKHVELSHFKSFGGTARVPLRPGFTVISGPNGSGKSNILDALLFALGLSSSKGMRAERLPDLVNQSHTTRSRATVEASVTVTFDIGDVPLDDDEDGGIENRDVENGDSATEDGTTGGDRASHLNDPLADQNGHTNGRTREPTNGQHPPELPEPLPNEWRVTRKLRVTQQGTYTSTYFINGEPCTLTQLHEQLQRLRIYPEGYNVVLQGDVTGIISMNPRERREIIDELAGVASFDRKISQAKEKLDAVKEREERFRIVEKELIAQRDRLAQDRIKAEKYQTLRERLHERTQWEAVLVWRSHQRQIQQLIQRIEAGDRSASDLSTQIQGLSGSIQQAKAELERLNAHVKALGEDEQLALQSKLATQEAELRQLQRREHDIATASQATITQINQLQRDIQDQQHQLEQLAQEQQSKQRELESLQADRDRARHALNESRDAASAIASASESWVQEQTALRHRVEELLHAIEPKRSELVRLQERTVQLQSKHQAQTQALEAIARDIAIKQTQCADTQSQHDASIEHVQSLAQSLAAAEQDLQIQQETQTRLLHEQRDKQRQLDKLEAQTQAMQEAQGTRATQILLQTGLPGVCGLVAQLGRVDPQYQRALEISAGGRLGYLVVDDDGVAAAGIELLKQQRAGRATFLPLNKIRAPRVSFLSQWNRPEGMIDYAVNLIDCDDRYRDIFAYVFGNTVVFTNLSDARRNLGQFRIVTLDGELLETSGAMTGGSLAARQGSLHFGTVEAGESAEAIALRQRLHELDHILDRCTGAIAQATVDVKDRANALTEARQHQRELQIRHDQLRSELHALQTQQEQLQSQQHQQVQELATAQSRLQTLEHDLPPQETELQHQRHALDELEQSQTHSEWQQMQAQIRDQEAQLSDRQLALRTVEQRLQDLENQHQRIREKILNTQQRLHECRDQQRDQLNQQSVVSEQQATLNDEIAQTQSAIARLEQTLTAEKQARDRAERQLRDHQTQYQHLDWQLQKLRETQQAQRDDLANRQQQLATQEAELPDPLPEIPADMGLEQLQQELRSLQKRLQAMEPVNMLALDEYNRTQERLEELSQKLSTLEEERTELLLRIENFTTLRQRAFREAFDVVNQNFQTIFAELSDGDGYLQLDDLEDPFSSGLNLVAHPKGKPVRRLASMSGGEKSLTALSFIFALQRYRPSPFYAFDEVDMFLDGANVERLAKMIKHQAQQAQFIVVSLRRPMIESAERTIGVTQARGAYTQVLGLDLQPQRISM
ncbi:MAG: chromosome segregation protein SMC [Elainellaceae cyanobacterium]